MGSNDAVLSHGPMSDVAQLLPPQSPEPRAPRTLQARGRQLACCSQVPASGQWGILNSSRVAMRIETHGDVGTLPFAETPKPQMVGGV